ncbi:hypothetical protein DICPUDRAFT_159055 [Dictyostelium purpureum]|uniref:Fucosyltransferase n=1 Tax=Dictyostelium purpureum TaxID=5786 RepID=F1A361_DICPU|nr:uncharacterized protein DICPUDRAFT_159055 [Dictyostelium purpureum]EGC29375.1 hypothetical protein DICPUDRAFT_159055 [Dictyostelium purpureum]|eukprot:XP_003294103.1 hypothetical protein DICPUDRAFT_159055 [Dictyostelium purpureum]
MAFENSKTDHYVTKKFFGFIMEHPTVKNYFPRLNAAIFVNNFKSPKELADHLLYLDRNDKEFENFFDFKKYGKNERVENSKVNDDCKTCSRSLQKASGHGNK